MMSADQVCSYRAELRSELRTTATGNAEYDIVVSACTATGNALGMCSDLRCPDKSSVVCISWQSILETAILYTCLHGR
jgi:hypothetical protein